MGLDITAYSKVKLVEAGDPDLLYAEKFADGDGLAWDPLYVHIQKDWHVERADGLVDGVYSNDGTSMKFHAGSYGWYNWWREQLAKMVGIENIEEFWNGGEYPEAFGELIDFYDNEGIIGPVTSKKLHKDFVKFRKKAVLVSESLEGQGKLGTFWMEKYDDWLNAFGVASGKGLVSFH